MDFYLDQDVSALVRSEVLLPRGHNCWTASQAGNALASDRDQAIYAEKHGAVLVSHDHEFARRQRENTVGRHLWLDCDHPDAVDVLALHIDDIVPILSRRSRPMWIRVTRSQFVVRGGQWQ